MSLKIFHIFFILVSLVVTGSFGLWCFLTEDGASLAGAKWMGTISLIVTAALAIYVMKIPSLAICILVGVPRIAEACSVCFGDPDSPHTQGMNNAILFLLAVTAGVLAAFAGFFIYLWRRSRVVGAAACVDATFLGRTNRAEDNGTPMIAG
jgi:hypothetical protein